MSCTCFWPSVVALVAIIVGMLAAAMLLDTIGLVLALAWGLVVNLWASRQYARCPIAHTPPTVF